MEPIISPWTIFALSHIETVRALILILGTTGIAILATFFKEISKTLKGVILSVVTLLFLVALLFPTKETLIAMYIANHVTPDNLSNAQEIITTIIKQAK